MAVDVTSVTPRRARGTTVYTINGTGFGAGLAQNDVLASGSSCTLITANPVQITLNLPFLFFFGIVRDVHVQLQVINLTTGESAYTWIRVKANVDEVADAILVRAQPGPFELTSGPTQLRPRYAEAKDSERLVTLLEAITQLPAEGQVLAGTGAGGVEEVGGAPAAGGYLVADPAEATGLRWTATDAPLSLPYGGAVPAAPTNLFAGGDQAAAAGATTHGAPFAGTVDLISLLVKSAGPTLDQVRLLVNGAPVFDSGAGLGLGNNAHFTTAPAAAVALQDSIQVEATSLGGTTNLVGLARLTPA